MGGAAIQEERPKIRELCCGLGQTVEANLESAGRRPSAKPKSEI
jgi:hypothetical protein